jgi:hypothetical protein
MHPNASPEYLNALPCDQKDSSIPHGNGAVAPHLPTIAGPEFQFGWLCLGDHLLPLYSTSHYLHYKLSKFLSGPRTFTAYFWSPNHTHMPTTLILNVRIYLPLAIPLEHSGVALSSFAALISHLDGLEARVPSRFEWPPCVRVVSDE